MMRQDQLERLHTMAERLTDVLLSEMNPENWPGAGEMPSDMSQQTRGDRYWCKKNCAATLSVIMRRPHSLIGVAAKPGQGDGRR